MVWQSPHLSLNTSCGVAASAGAAVSSTAGANSTARVRRMDDSVSGSAIPRPGSGLNRRDLQFQSPGLSLHRFTELFMGLDRDDLEAVGGVDPTRTGKHGVGPQRHRGVAGLAGEAQTPLDKMVADAAAAGHRLDVEQP